MYIIYLVFFFRGKYKIFNISSVLFTNKAMHFWILKSLLVLIQIKIIKSIFIKIKIKMVIGTGDSTRIQCFLEK